MRAAGGGLQLAGIGGVWLAGMGNGRQHCRHLGRMGRF